jgi:hypothetical protein
VICCFDVGHGLETLRTRHDGVGLLDHCRLLRNLLIECGFSLIEFLAAVTAHKAAAAVAREERQREEANEPTADLVRAQVAAAAQGVIAPLYLYVLLYHVCECLIVHLFFYLYPVCDCRVPVSYLAVSHLS